MNNLKGIKHSSLFRCNANNEEIHFLIITDDVNVSKSFSSKQGDLLINIRLT